jgi:hypothetical protein
MPLHSPTCRFSFDLFKPMLPKIVALAVSVLVVGLTAAAPAKKRAGEGAVLLPRRELLQVLGASQRPLITDYLWIQLLQSIGKAWTEQEYRDIYAYADLTTDLDPRFYLVYTFSGLNISYNRGRETWVNVGESLAILDKGLRSFPDDLKLKLYRAYTTVNYAKDYVRGAELLAEAARDPQAPGFISALATRLYAQAGRFDVATSMAEELRNSAPDEQTRNFFERRLKQVELEQVLQEVDRACDRYRARAGNQGCDLSSLIASGELRTVPIDPLGGDLYIDDSGRARSTSERQRLQFFTEGEELR